MPCILYTALFSMALIFLNIFRPIIMNLIMFLGVRPCFRVLGRPREDAEMIKTDRFPRPLGTLRN